MAYAWPALLLTIIGLFLRCASRDPKTPCGDAVLVDLGLGLVAVAAKAAELGGRLVVCPYDALGFRATVVADPQGAALTVGQPITEP